MSNTTNDRLATATSALISTTADSLLLLIGAAEVYLRTKTKHDQIELLLMEMELKERQKSSPQEGDDSWMGAHAQRAKYTLD